jgi:hypothetical protein
MAFEGRVEYQAAADDTFTPCAQLIVPIQRTDRRKKGASFTLLRQTDVGGSAKTSLGNGEDAR